MIKCEQMIKSSKSLIEFVTTSEIYRKKFSEQLRDTVSRNDELYNQVFEFDQNKRLTHISYELIQDKMSMLYESIDAISNAKYLEDKYQIRINNQKNQLENMKEEKVQYEQTIKTIVNESDKFKNDLRNICELKEKMENQRKFTDQCNKETISQLKQEITKLTHELDQCQAENTVFQRNIKTMKVEIDKQKQRIIRIK